MAGLMGVGDARIGEPAIRDRGLSLPCDGTASLMPCPPVAGSPNPLLPVMKIESEICLGPIEAIPIGEGRRFMVNGLQIAVFRPREGGLFATQHTCPHAGGPLAEGLIGSGHVLCPLHAYKFNVTTGACLNDASCQIRTYRVRQDGSEIFVSLA